MNTKTPPAPEADQVASVAQILADPTAVHLNMLRGGIAKPSPRNIWHLYGDKALINAMPESAKAAIRNLAKETGQ